MSHTASVILVEDDTRLRELVSEYLKEQQFTVTALGDGAELLNTVKRSAPDVIILDIMLPGEDGLSLCRRLRQIYQGPLLFMTAKNDAIDEILGLEMGADDYVIKPVEPRLLLARIQALLRRAHAQPATDSATLTFGALHIDKKSRAVYLNDARTELTSHEFDILLMLAENAGSVVLRDTIYQKII